MYRVMKLVKSWQALSIENGLREVEKRRHSALSHRNFTLQNPKDPQAVSLRSPRGRRAAALIF
jgi:hypothetical protein